MEVTGFFETLVSIYWAMQHHIQEDDDLTHHLHNKNQPVNAV
jgi:hypothetical protein